MTRIGVVVFPGSNCDRDTLRGLRAGRRRGRSSCGTSRARSTAWPAVRAAGRLRLRRLPARRRDRPVQPGDAGRLRLRRRGRARPRDLQRLPGARRGRARAGRAAPQSRPAVPRARGADRGGAARHAVHERWSGSGGRCGCRSPTARAATSPTTRRSTSWSATARSCSATSARTARRRARGRPGEPERLAARHRRRAERARQRGRPDAPPGARRGRAARLRRRAADPPLAGRERRARAARRAVERDRAPVAVVGGRDDASREPPSRGRAARRAMPLHRALGADRRRARRDPRAARAATRTTSSWRCSA